MTGPGSMVAGTEGPEAWTKLKSGVELREVSIKPSWMGMGTGGHGRGDRAFHTARTIVENGPQQK